MLTPSLGTASPSGAHEVAVILADQVSVAHQVVSRTKRGSAAGRPVSIDAERYRDRDTAGRCINN